MNPMLQRALEEIDSATAGMDEQQLLYHLPGKWSSAQVLEHLAIAFSHTIKGMERNLVAGKNLGGAPTFKQRLAHWVVLDLGHFPQGRKSPEMVLPTGQWGGQESVDTIRKNLIEMDKKAAQCREKLGVQGYILDHPVLGPLKLDQWCRFHYVHTRHHMKQVRALKVQQSPIAASAQA